MAAPNHTSGRVPPGVCCQQPIDAMQISYATNPANSTIEVYLPHMHWLEQRQSYRVYRSLRLQLRLSVYREVIETMASALARSNNSIAIFHCNILLGQVVCCVSDYFRHPDPFNPDAAEDRYIAQAQEDLDSVLYFFSCLSPPRLRIIASRIAREVLDYYGRKKRGLKTVLAASIEYAKKVTHLQSVQRTWLPKEFQPLYSVKAINNVRDIRMHNPAAAPKPNMGMVTAILAQIAADGGVR